MKCSHMAWLSLKTVSSDARRISQLIASSNPPVKAAPGAELGLDEFSLTISQKAPHLPLTQAITGTLDSCIAYIGSMALVILDSRFGSSRIMFISIPALKDFPAASSMMTLTCNKWVMCMSMIITREESRHIPCDHQEQKDGRLL